MTKNIKTASLHIYYMNGHKPSCYEGLFVFTKLTILEEHENVVCQYAVHLTKAV